jgi:hypothetical protein
MNSPKIGYVYFIYCPDLYSTGKHCIKIGYTKNLNTRLQQLQTGNPYKLEFYKIYQSSNYKNIETELHHKYNNKRILNEWFNISLKDVDKEIALLNNEIKIPWYTNLLNKICNIFKKD